MPDLTVEYLRLPGHAAASRWQIGLNNRLPLLGGAVRRQAAAQLIRLAEKGNLAAAWLLARALDTHFDSEIRNICAGYLARAASRPLAAAWTVWSLTRAPALGQVLLRRPPAHGAPDDVLALSLLHLQHMDTLKSSTPGMVHALVQLCGDGDGTIAGRARFAIAHLTAEKGIAALCQLWVEQRSPGLLDAIVQAGYQPETPLSAAILVALKMNRLERVTQGSPAILPIVLPAASDNDDEIRTRAHFCLLNLQKQETIDSLCQEWAEKRSSMIEKMIMQAGYLPHRPVAARVLTALKLDRMDVATAIQPDELPALFSAGEDRDPQIAERAQSALRQLAAQPTRDRLCEMVVNDDSTAARKIALECGYLHSDPAQRAVFLFLTDQMTAYDTLDYDRRLLNAVYETAGNSLRQRIIRRIQQTGRQDFLTILAGADYRSRAARMTSIESQLLVQMLSANRDWERLWTMAQELSLEFAVDIIHRLSSSGWQPPNPYEQAVFVTLSSLAARRVTLKPADLAQAIPPAVPRATLNIRGRVNDLAFAPSGTLLAIGSGNRRVALWDYQHARLLQVYKSFDHSIGNVTYTETGTLCCAERAPSGVCGVYRFSENGPQRIGQHSQSVTALEPYREDLLLSTGRDGLVALWDIRAGGPYRSTTTTDWPRSACLSTACSRVALLSADLDMLNLPDLAPQPFVNYRWARGTKANRGVMRSAAFLPGSEDLLVGLFNGHVIHYQRSPKAIMRPISRFPQPVEGIRAIPGHSLITVAGSNGEVRFFSLPDLKQAAKVDQPAAGRLTSLHISPDGSFMATGSNDSTMTLWDLRVLDIPELFTRPLAAASPAQIPAVMALSEYPDLPEPLRNAILIMGHLLQLRFRYDIQVSDLPTIPVGQFDVMIDE